MPERLLYVDHVKSSVISLFSHQMDCEEGIYVGISPYADQITTDAVRQKIELETRYAPTRQSAQQSTGPCVPVRDIKRIFFADQKTLLATAFSQVGKRQMSDLIDRRLAEREKLPSHVVISCAWFNVMATVRRLCEG